MWACLALALGVFSVAYFPWLPDQWLLLLFLALLSWFLYRRYWRLALGLIGVLYGTTYGYWLLDKQLPVSLNAERFLVTGRVEGLPAATARAQRFYLRIHHIQRADETSADRSAVAPELSAMQGELISLNWYWRYGGNSSDITEASTVASGDLWQLEVKLRRPRGFVNPAGFDYQHYLLQQKIMATGYVRTSAYNHSLGRQCTLWQSDCWRQGLRDFFVGHSTVVEDGRTPPRYLGPLLGLLIGDREQMTSEQWQLLRHTGTIHLLAISGLHIGLAAFLGFMVGQLCCRTLQLLLARCQCVWLVVWLPSFFSIGCAWTYGLLAGLSLPTQRALVMVITFNLFLLLKRRTSPWFLLSFALACTALLDPLSVRSQSFWLSYTAVAILMYVFIGRQTAANASTISKILLRSRSLLKAQCAIAVGLLLPGLLLVQAVSTSSPIANLLAVPLVSISTVPLLLLSLVSSTFSESLSLQLFFLADKSLQLLFACLQIIDQLPLKFWRFDRGEIGVPALMLAFVSIVWLLSPRGLLPYRWLGLAGLLPLFFPPIERPPLRVTFLEVGQGTSVVVETANHRMVYDVGKHFSERFNAGEHIVAPYLLSRGYSSVNRLYLSHGDADHAGSVDDFRSVIEVEQQFTGERMRVPGQQCYAGQYWRWDDVDFRVIWPTKDFLARTYTPLESNNFSCVIAIRYGVHRLLLSGDIEAAAEREIINADLLGAQTVLLVPHHGSRSSSHQSWVERLQPRHSVFTAGFSNAYGHPDPAIESRYHRVQSQLWHTGRDGAVQFVFDDRQRYRAYSQRQYRPRYWYD